MTIFRDVFFYAYPRHLGMRIANSIVIFGLIFLYADVHGNQIIHFLFRRSKLTLTSAELLIVSDQNNLTKNSCRMSIFKSCVFLISISPLVSHNFLASQFVTHMLFTGYYDIACPRKG